MTTYIDIHAIHSVPPSNLNRDDNGSPKTATYGGVLRHRVSSQSWKRATREYFNDHFAEGNKGFRTKNIVQLVAQEMMKLDEGMTFEGAAALATPLLVELKVVSSKTQKNADFPIADALFLISQKQVEAIANGVINGSSAKELKGTLVNQNSLDLALFGRMVADSKDMNVEAADQFAHALSTHAVAPEFDYFTASDDFGQEDHAGAAMMGDTEFTSSTLYRYTNINLNELAKHFGDSKEAVATGVVDFIDSFVNAIPSGKQNSFAGRTRPDAVIVTIRQDVPVNLVGAFEKPIISNSGYVLPSIQALCAKLRDEVSQYDTVSSPTFAIGSSDEIRNILAEVAGIKTLAELKEEVSRIIIEELA